MRFPALLATLLGTALLAVPATATPAAGETASTADRGSGIATRSVSFDLVNSDEQLLDCGTRRAHQVRGRLVGPARVVRGDAPAPTINVLLHDAQTGGWFWNLRGQGKQDYATSLARQGVTTLVIDRLGYDRSTLRDGSRTCLAAQAFMAHQIVQRLYSGRYVASGTGPEPRAGHVVLQGHGTGATIAQLEAATYSDVAGLVLMSPPTTSPTAAAVDGLTTQLRACGSASYAATSVDTFSALLFRTAPRAVRSAAVRLRNATPCGDVTSVATAVLAASTTSRAVDVPVLVLRGSRDAASRGTVKVSSSDGVVRRTVWGAGNALVLEKQAPQVQRQVLTYLRKLDPRVR